MKINNIAISGWGSVSSLGVYEDEIWNNYLSSRHLFSKIEELNNYGAILSENAAFYIDELRLNNKYKNLDPTTLFAMQASKEAVFNSDWVISDVDIGVNIGSSRGATANFEKYHSEFLFSERSITTPFASPLTTLGNVATWVAQDLGLTGLAFSHSITCSSSLHSIANAIAWIESGMADRFIAGGAEAPLTPFTMAQVKAMKIYSQDFFDKYPCKALDFSKNYNTMVLGEGAAMFCLEKSNPNSKYFINGIGYGVEKITHGASLSSDAYCMQVAMKKAIGQFDKSDIDVVIMHAPGTILGDKAELRAIESVFGSDMPLVTCNKWKIGHTYGASGALSIEMALLMLKHQVFIPIPYLENKQPYPAKLKNILVNAVGFGGNAVSVLISL